MVYGIEPDITFDLRVGLPDHGRVHIIHGVDSYRATTIILGSAHHEDPLHVVMKPVIRMLMHDIQQDGHANSQTDGQTADIDDAVELVSEKVPNGDAQIAEDHIIK